MELPVVHTEEDEPTGLRPYHGLDLPVIVALICAAKDEHDRGLDALQGITTGVDVRSLRIVDVFHIGHACHRLQAVLNAAKRLQTTTDRRIVGSGQSGCRGRSD